jgi:hypothetical protein
MLVPERASSTCPALEFGVSCLLEALDLDERVDCAVHFGRVGKSTGLLDQNLRYTLKCTCTKYSPFLNYSYVKGTFSSSWP